MIRPFPVGVALEGGGQPCGEAWHQGPSHAAQQSGGTELERHFGTRPRRRSFLDKQRPRGVREVPTFLNEIDENPRCTPRRKLAHLQGGFETPVCGA